MSTAARKARKRAGIPLIKPTKTPTRPYGRNPGLGLMSFPEYMARDLSRPFRPL